MRTFYLFMLKVKKLTDSKIQYALAKGWLTQDDLSESEE